MRSPHEGVHEVEVDFASGQASVLFSKGTVTVKELMQTVEDTGYKPWVSPNAAPIRHSVTLHLQPV